MVDFFDLLYNSIVNNRKILERIRYYSLLRLIIRLCANIFVPIYFVLTQKSYSFTLVPSNKKERRIIVSLTSYPARINRIWIVVETLLRQQTKPDMVILWLSIKQFPTIKALPRNLTRLQKRGLIIRLCEDDLKSHKKYFYALKEFPKDYIITVDDDVIYNSRLLLYLIELNNKYPSAICCNQASRITMNDGNIMPYLSWRDATSEQAPNFAIMPIGLGGILYPPNSLYHGVFDVNTFKKYCFLADDIWLNTMARLNGTYVAKTGYDSNYLPVINFHNTYLNSKNIYEGLNDQQLKSIREYFITQNGIDPFMNLDRNNIVV